MAEESSACGGVIFCEVCAHRFIGADPTSDGHEGDEVGIFLIGHAIFDFVLGGLEFFLELIPEFLVGEPGDACAPFDDIFADAESFGQGKDVFTDTFDLGCVFGFDGDIAIGDEATEVEGELGSAGKIGGDGGAEESCPIDFSEFIEGGHKLAGHGNGKFIGAGGFSDFFWGEVDGGGGVIRGRSAQAKSSESSHDGAKSRNHFGK